MNVGALLRDIWDSIRERDIPAEPADLHEDPRVAELELDAAETQATVRMLASRATLHGSRWRGEQC